MILCYECDVQCCRNFKWSLLGTRAQRRVIAKYQEFKVLPILVVQFLILNRWYTSLCIVILPIHMSLLFVGFHPLVFTHAFVLHPVNASVCQANISSSCSAMSWRRPKVTSDFGLKLGSVVYNGSVYLGSIFLIHPECQSLPTMYYLSPVTSVGDISISSLVVQLMLANVASS